MTRWPRIVLSSGLLLLFSYILLFNATHLPNAWTSGIMPQSWTCVADLLACRQRWNLFPESGPRRRMVCRGGSAG